MSWIRKLFGIFFLFVATVLVASIVVTFSQAVAYFALLYTCITSPCKVDSLKDILLGVITYLFMAFMVYYLGRRGLILLADIKPEQPEPSSILDDSEFRERTEKTKE
jgi:hypothetical protein